MRNVFEKQTNKQKLVSLLSTIDLLPFSRLFHLCATWICMGVHVHVHDNGIELKWQKMEYTNQPSMLCLCRLHTADFSELQHRWRLQGAVFLSLKQSIYNHKWKERTVVVVVVIIIIKWGATETSVPNYGRSPREERVSAVGSRTNLRKSGLHGTQRWLLNRHGWNAWNEHEEFL